MAPARLTTAFSPGGLRAANASAAPPPTEPPSAMTRVPSASGRSTIVRLDGEILPQRRLIALCVGRVGCLAGCAVRLAVTAPDHGDREVAAVRKIAGLRRHQRAADLRHLGGQTRLAMGQERNRQPPFGGGAAHDQGLEPIASVAALDGEEGRFLDQAGVVGYRRQACRHAGCPAWRLGDRPRRR
jgi:hypothetical protein